MAAACGQPGNEGGMPAPPEPGAQESGALTVGVGANLRPLEPVLAAYRKESGRRYQVMPEMPDAAAAADLYIGGSLADLRAVAEADALRPDLADDFASGIAPALRDPESQWFPLSVSPRVIVYDASRITGDEIAAVGSYADLREDAFRKRLCLSSSQVPGNRLLVAWLIRREGIREAEIIVRQWLANLAESELPDDAGLLAAIAAGPCAIGIVDGSVMAGSARPPALTVQSLPDDGTLVDIRGAGVTRHASRPAEAGRLLEWLTSSIPNALFADTQRAFPVADGAPVSAAVSRHLQRPAAYPPLSELGFLLEDADLLIDRAGYR